MIYLHRLDFRSIFIVLMLMGMSLLIISATSGEETKFFTPLVKVQCVRFAMGSIAYLFFAWLDYHRLREWTWILYIGVLLLLIGLFFMNPIQNVRRWYRIPFIHFGLQPSEFAKLIVVIALSWFLEKNKGRGNDLKVITVAIAIVLLPLILILKQPDLGTALILFPITLVMFYFGDIQPRVVKWMSYGLLFGLLFVSAFFLGIISHEQLKPYATKVLKEYQYERLNPNTYHHQAAKIAISLGKWKGSGWHQSEYTAAGWLPAASTDSVFAGFTEEFGLIGAFFMLILFFGLIYFSFQTTAVAKDDFGRLLSAGISVCLAIHVVVNVGMMCGILPITGVPLLLVSYGGSSVLSTMIALGILQSVYTRRFRF